MKQRKSNSVRQSKSGAAHPNCKADEGVIVYHDAFFAQEKALKSPRKIRVDKAGRSSNESKLIRNDQDR